MQGEHFKPIVPAVEPSQPDDDLIDPDPFAIAFTLLAIVFAGGSYLETRRQTDFMESRVREDFRRAWFDSRRTLIHARRVTEEFATYAAEDKFGTVQFLFGNVKLTIDKGRAQQLRRLHGNAHTTAEHMADDLDRLADGLGPESQETIDQIHSELKGIKEFPENYIAVIRTARRAIDLYQKLVDEVGEREKFEES